MNRSIKVMILAIVAVLSVCATASIISEGGLSAEDAPVTTVGKYLDETSGITFTLYSDQTAEATTLTSPAKELTIPSTVTSDGVDYTVTSISSSFKSMDSTVETLTIGASIEKINDSTGSWSGFFRQASKLKTVTFEEGSKLTYIGDGAFRGCTALSTINLPEGLKEIGDYVFEYQTSNGYLPTGRAVLYYNLYNLSEITLPASLEKIGDGSLPTLVCNIKLAEGNNNFVIENGVLYDAGKTTVIRAFNPTGDIVIPDTVTKINTYAFSFQTSDVMPESTYTSKFFNYSENPVKNDPSFGKITIPSSVKEIGAYAFRIWTTDGKMPYSGMDIPSKFKANLENRSFGNNPFVKEIYVEDGMTVNNYAYDGCTKVDTVYLIVKDLSKYSGIYSSSAKTLVLSDKVETVAGSSMSVWSSLESVTYVGKDAVVGEVHLPSTIKTIGNYFIYGAAVKKIDLSGYAGAIGNSSFSNLTKLESIDFGDNVTGIGDRCFNHSDSLTEVIIPSSVKTIGDAFEDCEKLASIILEGNPTIDDDAFCDSVVVEGNLKVLKLTYRSTVDGTVTDTFKEFVKSVSLPKDTDGKVTDSKITISKYVVSIVSSALPDEGITDIEIEEGNQFFVLKDRAIYSMDMKTLFFVPDYVIGDDGKFIIDSKVETIGDYALSYIPKLTSVEFAKDAKVSAIGNNAFYESGIKSFVAPASITSVGSNAFSYSSIETADFTAVGKELSLGGSSFLTTPLKKVEFSQDTKVIVGYRAFYKTSLTSVSIYSGEIGNSVFDACSNLESVFLGSGVTKTGNYFLDNTPKMKQLTIMNADPAVIGKTITIASITTKGDMTIVVPDESTLDYSAFEAKYPVSRITSFTDGNSFILPMIAGITFTKGAVTDAGVSYTFVLDKAYDRSDVKIKIGETDVEIKDGAFVIKPTGKSQEVSVSGVEINKYAVTVKVDNATTTFDAKTVEHGDDIIFNILPNDGYVLSDAKATVGEETYVAYHNSWITIPNIVDDITITITGVVGEQYDVTFIKDGKVVDTKTYTHGQEFVPSAESALWYLYGSTTAYDFKNALSDDTAFFAAPITSEPKVDIGFFAARGELDASWIVGDISNGDSILKGYDVTFAYDGEGSYEVVGWFVNGKYTESSDTTLTIKNVQQSVSVQVAVMFEQADYKYIVNAPMVLPDEEYEKLLWIGTYKDPLDMGGDYYANMPSGYTAVGDYLYVVSGGKLIRIDLNSDFTNGMPADTLQVTPESVESSIDYYGGYIFNGTLVYDLDLNYLFEAPAKVVGTYDGDFLSFANNKLIRWNASIVDGEWKVDTIWSVMFAKHYGKTVIDGDYFYHLPVSSASDQPDRAIESVDLRTGKIKSTVSINEYHYGHYYDDGWLTVYDGWAYIASYTSGLFGEQNPYVTARTPTLLRVAINDGVFDENSIQIMEMPNNTQQSGLVVFNGRGYINSGNELVVIDMESFKMIYKEAGARTHGGIVLNTYYANADNNYKVYIYVVPYGGSETVWVYSDDQTKTEAGEPQKIENTGKNQYATTHIRTSASGYIYWYNDSSIFFITGAKYHEVSYVADGKVLMTDDKAVNGTPLNIPKAPAKEGYSFVGWYNYDGTPVLPGDVVAGDMTIMAIYAPVVSEANGMMFFDYYAGEYADKEVYLLLIAEYDNNIVWNYQKVAFNELGECQDNIFGVSKNGLKQVSISVVDSCDPLNFNTLDRVVYSFGA